MTTVDVLQKGPIVICFTTATGSEYEMNRNAKQIRRIRGTKPPQPRQGQDGEWRSYVAVSDVRFGENVLISWDPETTPRREGAPSWSTPGTITSPVTRSWVRI